MKGDDAARTYLRRAAAAVEDIADGQLEAIDTAAAWAAAAVRDGGLIHTFGTGHSHLLALEIFYRAGGLLTVNPVLVPALMLHEGGRLSSAMEQLEGLAETILVDQPLAAGDVMIVISNSGRNAAPIEMALAAQEHGLRVVAVTSLRHSRSVPSRHSSGRRLYEIADLVLDNGAPAGDAAVAVGDGDLRAAALSTVTGAAVLQAVTAAAAARLAASEELPPVMMSGNLDEAEGHNRRVRSAWADRLERLAQAVPDVALDHDGAE